MERTLRIVALLTVIAAGTLVGIRAYTQTGSPKTITALTTEINNSFPNNTSGLITPLALRQVTLDMVNSSGNLLTPNQILSGGANVTPFPIGTLSGGTLTVNCGNGPLQFLTNSGSFTLAAPASDGSCDILDTNGGSPGSITFTGFTVGTTGDTLTLTPSNKFIIHIESINLVSTYLIKALQ